MIFVTTCGKDYTRPWIFPSLSRLSCRVVCLLDPADGRELPPNAERVPCGMDRFYQAGQFLEYVPGLADDDLLCVADADAVIQRDFSPEELAAFGEMPGIALGYNMRPGQLGRHELELLHPKLPLSELGRQVNLSVKSLEDCRMYNTGLMIARVSFWRKLLGLYERTVGGAMSRCTELFFDYPGASMQYFICCVLHEFGLPVHEMGYETHSHGHFDLTAGHAIRERKLLYQDRPVFFAHFVSSIV